MPVHPLAQMPACARPARVLTLWPRRRIEAVLLHGLQRGVTATQLRKLPEADLATLGSAAADVEHIEVGRLCAREVALLETHAQLATAAVQMLPRRQGGGVCSLRRLTNTMHVFVQC